MQQDTYDVSGWDQAWEDLKAQPQIEEARPVFEELVLAFPTKASPTRAAAHRQAAFYIAMC
jgi:hypothetical protein